MTLRGLASCLLALAACSDDQHGKPKDAPVDMVPPSDGKCPVGSLFFTGELVDWNSTDTNFCGVFDAVFAVAGNPTANDQTSPNGRFEVCIPSAATTQVNVMMPTGASQCTGSPGSYTIPGIAVASQAVIATTMPFSSRAITMEKTAAFFSGFGLTYDITKAQVFVHVEGTPHAVTLGSAHDAVLVNDGTTWSASAAATGKNVYFPNVVVGGGTTNVTAGGSIGEGSIPLVANTFTYVTLVGP